MDEQQVRDRQKMREMHDRLYGTALDARFVGTREGRAAALARAASLIADLALLNATTTFVGPLDVPGGYPGGGE